jgi:hypothetical protein
LTGATNFFFAQFNYYALFGTLTNVIFPSNTFPVVVNGILAYSSKYFPPSLRIVYMNSES